MLNRRTKRLIVVALTLLLGAHWMVLQSVAWLGMMVNFSQTAPLHEALAKTFDGQHPCQLCKLVREGKAKEQKRDLVKSIVKNELLLGCGPSVIDANKCISQTVLIGLLNPVIRGWVNCHQHCAAKETFDRVDHEIWRALWEWARRRHPKKSRDWVKKHCFPALRNRA